MSYNEPWSVREVGMTSSILKKYQLIGPLPQHEYVDQMAGRFRKHGGVRFMDLVDEALEEGWTPERYRRTYNVLHGNASMSLFVTSHQYTRVYAHILKWMSENVADRPEAFVDLGCANGLLTLCLSDLWGGAAGVGIDRLGKAVVAARTLATRFENRHVSFVEADLGAADEIDVPAAPLVIGSFVFHELLDRRLEDWAAISANVRKLMVPGGELVTINRFPHASWQMRVLDERLGLGGLQRVRSDEITFGAETFPIGIYQRPKL